MKDNSKGFSCRNCNKFVPYHSFGTKNRNHCPFCLYSLHVDNQIGDRSSNCNGLMEPIAKMYKPDGEEVLVHKCIVCSAQRKNRVAGDDSEEAIAKLLKIDFF